MIARGEAIAKPVKLSVDRYYTNVADSVIFISDLGIIKLASIVEIA